MDLHAGPIVQIFTYQPGNLLGFYLGAQAEGLARWLNLLSLLEVYLVEMGAGLVHDDRYMLKIEYPTMLCVLSCDILEGTEQPS